MSDVKTRDELAEEYAEGWFNEPLVQARARVDFKSGYDAAMKLKSEHAEKLAEALEKIAADRENFEAASYPDYYSYQNVIDVADQALAEYRKLHPKVGGTDDKSN